MNPNFLANLIRQAGNNPTVSNAMNLYQRGDMSGVENIARNLCQSKGINPDEALRNAQKLFGRK